MKTRIKKVISFNIILLVIFFGYYFLNTNFNISIECPFYKITGLFCPGCGITRCIFSIIKLDFKSAFNYNMLVFILLPFFIIYYIYTNYTYIYNKGNKLIRNIPNYVIYILLFITISFGVLRNIEMFKVLSP